MKVIDCFKPVLCQSMAPSAEPVVIAMFSMQPVSIKVSTGTDEAALHAVHVQIQATIVACKQGLVTPLFYARNFADTTRGFPDCSQHLVPGRLPDSRLLTSSVHG